MLVLVLRPLFTNIRTRIASICLLLDSLDAIVSKNTFDLTAWVKVLDVEIETIATSQGRDHNISNVIVQEFIPLKEIESLTF